MQKVFLLIQKSVIFLLLLLLFLPMSSAWASVCRSYNGHQICIISIDRSAKNHWQYRTTISVDGAKQPKATYNCRDRLVQQNTKIVSFSNKNSGDLICSLFNNRR